MKQPSARVALNLLLLGAICGLTGSLWLRRNATAGTDGRTVAGGDELRQTGVVRRAVPLRLQSAAPMRVAMRQVATGNICRDGCCTLPCKSAVRVVEHPDALFVSIATRHVDTNDVRVVLERSLLRVVLKHPDGELPLNTLMLPFVADATVVPELDFANDQLMIRVAKPGHQRNVATLPRF